MINATNWIIPTEDGQYKHVREIENSSGKYKEVEEIIPASKPLQKALEKAEKNDLSHEDGSYILEDVERVTGLDMDMVLREAVERGDS